jgi:polysaccharide export outer membrane protein
LKIKSVNCDIIYLYSVLKKLKICFMNKLIQSNILFCLLFIVIELFFSSCVTTKRLKYFQDIPDSTRLNNLKLSDYINPAIHPEDVLSVTILTADPTATNNVNSNITGGGGAGSTSGSNVDPIGYIVDNMGYIEIPILGKIKVSNLTLAQAKDAISLQAKLYFLNPTVIVKNKSFKITLLGEVAKPGLLYIATPKVNILDAIGMGGDLTSVSKRDNILLIRQNDNNTLSFIRINLTKSDILRSPYYYLQSNDVIYVEPNNSKAITADATFSRGLTVVSSLLSLISIILLIARR